MLDVDDLRRCEIVLRSVQVASESDTAFIYLDIVTQREGLKSPTVRQKTFRVFRESVQFSHFGDHIVPGTDVHMVGVRKNDLRFDEGRKVRRIEGLDGTDGPYRHENGCLHRRMGRPDGTGSGFAVCFIYLKLHCVIISPKLMVRLYLNLYFKMQVRPN